MKQKVLDLRDGLVVRKHWSRVAIKGCGTSTGFTSTHRDGGSGQIE